VARARGGPSDAPSLGEQVCLALVAQEPRHGWSIVRTLAPDGDLGRIWSLSRPLTYRALDRLAADGLITARGEEPGGGGRRTIWAATPSGRRRARAWLRRPVGHLRDVRTEFLLKYALCRQAGIDTDALVRAQLDRFAPAFAALRAAARGSDDPVARWRKESSLATERFLRSLL
jgi:PadR family transcriptional regulator AphA